MNDQPLFGLDEILAILPHRPPFLFVDRVVKLIPHQRIVAERALRHTEPQFVGHFPNRPMMPGVLVTEALAQTSGLLLGLTQQQGPGGPPASPPMFYLAANSMKYTHPAVPGDVLVLQAETDKSFGGLHRFNVEANAGRNLVASGSLTLAFVGDKP
jgi:3-hydroxyacyl-[acyl-carrier-protein] dehydratase